MENKKEDLIDLDEAVIRALKFFSISPLPEIEFNLFSKPLVVGSQNAAVTGKILFNDKNAIFASESNFLDVLEQHKDIDGAFIISASGGKDAPIIIDSLKKKGIHTVLLTTKENSSAQMLAEEFYVFPHIPEPYTYNVSTYLGMILEKTKENPKEILKHIEKIDKKIPKTMKKYNAFYLIIPNKFEICNEMFLTKFDELFGAVVSERVYTLEQTKHAKTVVPYEQELFVSFGMKNKIFGKKKVEIPLYEGIDFAGFIAIVYYFIGKVQKQHPPYFKKNIGKYVKLQSKIFKEKMSVWVR